MGFACGAMLARSSTAARAIVATLLVAGAVQAPALAAGEAEIISLVGRGERREAEATPWIVAAVQHRISPGGFVRTLANSRMGLLLPDRNQLQLNQNSQMQIKSAADAAAFTQTTVQLNSGRAWSQARPQAAPAAPPPGTARPPRLTVETPSATMSIRGTEWEVEVLPDGRTQIAVITGIVEMANDHGTLTVGPGEGGLAERGKAPVKLQIVNPKARVQWVSSWTPQPRRWAGTGAAANAQAIAMIEAGNFDGALKLLMPGAAADPAAAALAADLRIALGEVDAAIALLLPHANPQAGNPLALALLARAYARADRVAEGRRLIESPAHTPRANPEVLLAAAELAILEGDAEAARHAFRAIIEQQPNRAEAWYGIGLVESERENIWLAREALDRALAADSGYVAAQAERAAVETFAGNLGEARRQLNEILARHPDNYLVQTALGINLLKSGQAAEALDAFLKAGTIEPRYARAWLFSGVAFYQLGERARAMEAFRKAAELDPRDPLPHVLESLAIGDTLDYGRAIAAAQRAQELMPYLKSLNQVVVDQKGSANLGSALASFGMEEWASWYAREAYSPFWAGSHLFLADRYTGSFTKNSELFKGYITDPTVFGASNRFSRLVPGPGHYGKLEAYLDRRDWTQTTAMGTLNGLVVDPVPFSYYVNGDLSSTKSRDDPSRADSTNLTAGLGVRPSHDLSVFGFASKLAIQSDLRTPTLTNDNLRLHDTRGDFGASYKLSAQNELWFKAGSGKQHSDVSGVFLSSGTAASLNRLFRTTIFQPNGTLDRYHASTNESDLQFRHALGRDNLTFTWGVEQGTLKRPGELISTFRPAKLSFSQTLNSRSTDAYASVRWRNPGTFSVQGDLWAQYSRVDRSDLSTLNLIGLPIPTINLVNLPRQQRETELNPRLGAAWNYMPTGAVRLVGQKWRRPASISSLGPVDTEGIPVDDRLPSEGGLYKRGRLQLDHEVPGRYFVHAFADWERINNGIGGIRSIVPALDLTQLDDLRVRRDVFTAVPDLEATPQFPEGNVKTLGLATNVLLNRRQTIQIRYLRRFERKQTGVNEGLYIPYLPRDQLRVANYWTLPERWLVSAYATYRGSRFRDPENRLPLQNGTAFGFSVYWESEDKRHSLQGILDNLLTDKAAGFEQHSRITARYVFRF